MSGIVIIGGGVGGLMAALAAAPHPVTLLSAAPLGGEAASALAQGGLAAAIGADDSVALHIADTLAAGAGLCDAEAVSRIIGAAPELVGLLRGYGVRFAPELGLEAAHGRRRILHAGGDATGAEIMRALIAQARTTPSITFRQAAARRLLRDETGVAGVLLADGTALAADRVLLATGGIGGLFRHTTNPLSAIGWGLMLAQDAGAALRDLEFIQFHPTALDVPGQSLPLVSEAVRGEGARFIDETGAYFLAGGDLAARDVVARAVAAHQRAGHRVWLDLREVRDFAARFPTIAVFARRAGLDLAAGRLPVRPAAHFHMGGVAVDALGRTSLPGLYAAGETACTGLHGANRLASNSLLEAAVCGMAAGREMAGSAARRVRLGALPPPLTPAPEPVRDMMSAGLGVLRTAA
uniref:L-aspartate oxidase n=1 Tax=Acidocella sp. TaxID=50710 RepID=UPI00260A3DFA